MGFSLPSALATPSKALDLAVCVSTQQQDSIAQQIRQAIRDIEALIAGRDASTLGVRLQPGSWCVAECLDHLTQTTRVFLPQLRAAIAAAPRLRADRRLRTGFFPSLFIWNLNPPYRIRLKVLPQLAPQNPDAAKAWSEFVASQEELLQLLSSAAGLAIDDVRIKSPMYARISYNIYGAFRMLVAHQGRHIWQMGQILKSLDQLPAAGVA